MQQILLRRMDALFLKKLHQNAILLDKIEII